MTNGSTWNGRTIDQSAGGHGRHGAAQCEPDRLLSQEILTDNLNLTQGATAQHNWVVFRYAEILLNYAEAMNGPTAPTTTTDTR